ncbi:MAG: 2-amino-4-hydroxy-6-hydroxymethyldihydropteridine diphosphokinase [Oligoflexales bacterium]
MYRYLLAYGSNCGHREYILEKAICDMNAVRECVKRSRWLVTAPMPVPNEYQNLDFQEKHEDYLNFMEDVRSAYQPEDLYRYIVKLENQAGHRRDRRWSPRELDIDLVLWAEDDADSFQDCRSLTMDASLQIPHKGWPQRDFWRVLSQEIESFSL